MQPPLPPFHVVTTAALLLGWGTFTFVGMVAGALAGHSSWDLGFLIAFIGWGLLSRRRGHWIAGIVISVMLLLPGLLHAGLYAGGKIPWTHPGSLRDMISGGLLSVAAIYALVVLLRRTQREWFSCKMVPAGEKRVDKDVTSRIAAAVLVVSFFFSTLHQTLEWWSMESLRGSYPVKVSLIPYDAETGENLNAVRLKDSSNSPASRNVELPLFRAGTTATTDGMIVDLEGIANNPFRLTIGSEGYEDASVLIGKDPPDEIRVPMKRGK
ncbi:MAG: hypothetical protein KF712_10025 [Akkermansiaceae bacterium]|nr:hypothetical protein [Akkermansiaceae bacterium]